VQPILSLSPTYASLRAPAAEPTFPAAAALPPRVTAAWIAAGLAVACIAGASLDHSGRPSHLRDGVERVAGRAVLKTTASGADERWTASAVTVTLDPTLQQLGPGAKDAVVAAFGAWMSSGASVPDVTVDTSNTAAGVALDGVNRLLVGPITNPGYENAIALTTAYVDDSTGEVLEADTVFNAAYVFRVLPGSGTDCSSGYDLQDIATHEAGHFFGLGEDYQDTAAAMYVSSTQCEMHKRELTSVDVSVMTGLYAAEPGQSTRAGCGGRAAVGR
jgi:hypothetical protein